ncbi:AmmeMemoRadiSam system protein A [bacterium]|nr:AmmeMemoRadiSam system protein A [bacterium]
MEFILSSEEKKFLLKLVRSTLEVYLRDKRSPKPPSVAENLQKECGAFVTLHNHGQLRGCIGNMIASRPLINTIQHMAIAASTQDSRFPSITFDELKDIDVEISVLSPMCEIKDVNEIEVGKHGILISKGMYSGVLLPQVATEQGWDRDEFLIHTCYKAGLSSDAWRDPNTKIEIFSAQVFGELEDKKED